MKNFMITVAAVVIGIILTNQILKAVPALR